MPVIKLRGLPWSVSNADIVKFLDNIQIATKEKPNDPTDIFCIYLMTNNDGRPSGECFIELKSEIDLENAIKLNNALMGQRYIEVFRSNYDQLNKHLEESARNASNWHDPVVRLRGLPYGCQNNEIVQFFAGLNIANDGIMMVIDFSGRFNGEAFVTFDTIYDALDSLNRHKQKISNRYIEVFRSTFDELNYYASNTSNRSNYKMSNNSIRNNNNNNNSFNQRNKPYSRNDNRRRNQSSTSSSFTSPQDKPVPLMMSNIFNNNYDEDNFDNSDNFAQDYNDDYDYHNHNSSSSLNYNANNNENYQDIEESEYGIKMRGLPYSSNENDIKQFFQTLDPISVIFLNNKNRRPSGECEVYFRTYDEALKAMTYDKKFIGNRYVELFMLSDPPPPPPSSSTTTTATNTPITDSNIVKTISFGSLMNTNFEQNNFSNNYNNNNNNDDNNSSLNTPIQFNHIPPLLPPSSTSSISNDLLSMYSFSYNQFHNQFQQHQQQQQSYSNNSNNKSNRRIN